MKRSLSRSERNRLRNAAELLHAEDKDYRRASNYDFFIYLVLVCLVALSIRMFVGNPTIVDGDSMLPTLRDRERILVDRSAYFVREPERGDVIVCFYPGYTVSCVKRVIGLPGDYVLIEGGKIYINGNAMDESAYWNQEIVAGMAGRVVKQGHVFVVGDNRNYSLDSRSQDIGDIPYHKIEGKAVSVIWPLGSFRTLEHEDYPEYLWDPNDPDAVLISEWEREEELTKEEQEEYTGEGSGFTPGAMPEEPE